jgi:PAS domain S-box-containing protein
MATDNVPTEGLLMRLPERTITPTDSEVEILRRRVAGLERAVAEFEGIEKALRESEARYRSLVKHSSDAVYLFDPVTTRILEANAQFGRMVGYSNNEVAGLTLFDLVVLGRETIEENIRRVLQDGEFVMGVRQYRRKDGSIIDVEITSALIRYGDAHVVMVNMRDITERRRAEEAIQKQAAELREQAELLDVAEDAIIVCDLSNRITFWNRGAEERYGCSKAEVTGKVLHHLLKTRFPEPFEAIRTELFKKGRVERELVQETRDGRVITVHSRWALRRDATGRPVAVMEINNDISERKKVEQALKRAKDELELRVAERTMELQNANDKLSLELGRRRVIEEMLRKGAERYKNLFENSPIGIYRTDREGRILMANPTLLRMLGCTSFEELSTARSVKWGVEPTYLRKKFIRRLEKDERVRGFEATWKRRDGSVIFVRENAKAIRSADGALLYYEGTVEDISEQKKAEEAIYSYQKQLRFLASELSLTEERERRRIATLLHDHIGQILAISKIKLGALLEEASGSDRAEATKEVWDYIEQAIRYTRSLTFELSPPILYELGLESALEWLTEQVQAQHKISCDFESDGRPKPLSDEMRVFLFTAVRELLVNVVKHARAGRVKVSVRKVRDAMSIHVADDGTGFNAARMRSNVEENKGFGLFSIRERLHHLGGQMEVKSQKGRGTRAILVAPIQHDNKGRT